MYRSFKRFDLEMEFQEDSKVIERCVKLEAEMQISRQEEEKLSEVLASHRWAF